MMSCGHCSKWQHIACHDRADQQVGRKRRNWDVVEFFCLKCRGHVQPTMSIGAGQLSQSPYSGHAYSDRSGVNVYMGPVGGLPAASRPSIVNGGSRALGGERHSVSSPPPTAGAGVQYHQQPQRHGYQHQPQHQSHPIQQHPYGATANIAFSHYQPQQRGFSSSPLQQQQYNASGHTQPYGQHTISSSSSQYGQFLTNGGRQSYQVCCSSGDLCAGLTIQQQTSQTRWNVTTPAEHAPYTGVVLASNMSSGGSERYVHPSHNQPAIAASVPHTPAVQVQGPWPNHNHHVPLVDPQTALQHQRQIPHLSQFRYHPT
jgi:hypothetical protein